jgi:hypothetical protein
MRYTTRWNAGYKGLVSFMISACMHV